MIQLKTIARLSHCTVYSVDILHSCTLKVIWNRLYVDYSDIKPTYTCRDTNFFLVLFESLKMKYSNTSNKMAQTWKKIWQRMLMERSTNAVSSVDWNQVFLKVAQFCCSSYFTFTKRRFDNTYCDRKSCNRAVVNA